MRSVTCDWKDLSVGLDKLLSDIEPGVRNQVDSLVPKAGRKAARKVKENAKANGWDGKTGKRYVAGFHSKTIKSGEGVSSEVGNSDVPGLVHLLEKGHNTMAGRRVAGKPHMEPAFDEVSEEFFGDMVKAVDEVLGG